MEYYGSERNKFNFLLLFIVSFILHVFLIIFLPSFGGGTIVKDKIEKEKIRTGLISLAEEKEKKYASQKTEKFNKEEKVKKEEQKKEKSQVKKPEKKVAVVEKEKKTTTTKVENNEKKLLMLNNPVRKERKVDTKDVLYADRGRLIENNTEKNVDLDFNLAESRAIVEIDNSKISTEAKEIISVDNEVKIGEIEKDKIGTDYMDVSNIIDDKKISDSEVAVKGGKSEENKLPKNIERTELIEGNGEVDLLYYPMPVYPEKALQEAESAIVAIEFEVRGSQTFFMGITQKCGSIVIDRAVEKVAREWKLQITKDNMLVNGKVLVEINFGLKTKN